MYELVGFKGFDLNRRPGGNRGSGRPDVSERPLFGDVEAVLAAKGAPQAGRGGNPNGLRRESAIIAVVCVRVIVIVIPR